MAIQVFRELDERLGQVGTYDSPACRGFCGLKGLRERTSHDPTRQHCLLEEITLLKKPTRSS